MKKLLDTVLNYGRMIRFSHNVFALPFALASVLLVSQYYSLTYNKIFWILLAMISGRSAAMALNRIIDIHIDKLNPRTKMRELPTGVISIQHANLFALFSILIFILSAIQLNWLCALLSIPALGFFILYPYTKRFTWVTHFVLGACLALAPLGAWIAIAETLQGPVILLGLAVLFWVSGFDIIYAAQDLEFDLSQELFSIPKRFGLEKALKMAVIFHGITIGLLIWVGISFHLNYFYFVGCVLIAGIMLYEHSLVSSDDVSKAQKAFNANGWIGILYLLAVWVGIR